VGFSNDNEECHRGVSQNLHFFSIRNIARGVSFPSDEKPHNTQVEFFQIFAFRLSKGGSVKVEHRREDENFGDHWIESLTNSSVDIARYFLPFSVSDVGGVRVHYLTINLKYRVSLSEVCVIIERESTRIFL
jgi:hypothetical protein